ncbi:glycoside hydrolase family 16 protein [Bosea sp. 2YAB26]|uniref:glycoside hydrolase family 16 protein n=1 Tax=Bosea sp. 2YAB26 TaxID=3237478 RepID=UPI003F92F3F0
MAALLKMSSAAFLLAAFGSQQIIWAQARSDSCALRPVLLEEFDTLSIAARTLGPARWTAHTPWNGDFGDAQFMDPGPQGPFQIENGVLVITASKTPDGKWKSGLIAGADASGAGVGAQYGYFEVRMKMPPGPGTWPAFWLAPLKPANSSDGDVEIDVIEYYGQFTAAFQSVVHVWYKDITRKRGQAKVIDVKDGALVADFHTFGVDISPSKITFLLDRNEVWSYPSPPELNSKMYPLVNLALGSGWPIDKTPNPSKLYVDYVHVYERGSGPPEGCPVGLPR